MILFFKYSFYTIVLYFILNYNIILLDIPTYRPVKNYQTPTLHLIKHTPQITIIVPVLYLNTSLRYLVLIKTKKVPL